MLLDDLTDVDIGAGEFILRCIAATGNPFQKRSLGSEMIAQLFDGGAEFVRVLGHLLRHGFRPLDLLLDLAFDFFDHAGFQPPVFQKIENIRYQSLQVAFGLALLIGVAGGDKCLFPLISVLLVKRLDLADGFKKFLGLQHLVVVCIALVDIS